MFKQTARFQPGTPKLSQRGMLIDLLIHERLRKARFVPFVMTITSITNQVDHEVFMEFLTISKRSLGGLKAGLRVIRGDMDARYLESFFQGAGVQTSALLLSCRA